MKHIIILCLAILSLNFSTISYSDEISDNTDAAGFDDCKIVICNCCETSGLTYDIYSFNGVYQSSITTTAGGCMASNPIGPYAIGSTFYIQPLTVTIYHPFILLSHAVQIIR